MRVLAIDTALEACAAAVLDTSAGITASETLGMTRGHAEALMPLVARVMNGAGIEVADLDRIGVPRAPGSLRGAGGEIAAARVSARARGTPAPAPPPLPGPAAPLPAGAKNAQVGGATAARHDHIYLQVFGVNGRTLVG